MLRLHEPAALIVVDAVNDFCSPGGYADREGLDIQPAQAAVPRIRRLLRDGRGRLDTRVFIRPVYGTGANWYLSEAWLERAARANPSGGHNRYPVCAPGSWGAEFVPGLEVDPGGDLVVVKHRYSAFFGTELDLVLRARGVRTVLLAGVATNVCVESTARDAFFRDYHVVLVEDACAAYSAEEHAAAILNIRRWFGQVATVEEVLAAVGVTAGGGGEDG